MIRRNIIVAVYAVMVLLSCFGIFRLCYARPPHQVTSFLKEFLSDEYNAEKGLVIFSEYFVDGGNYNDRELEGEDISQITTAVQLMFEEVFYSFMPDIGGYTVNPLDRNCVIVRLYDKEGTELTPPIGFWFRVSEGKISSWKIGRLQPHSQYDEEYSSLWK